MTDKPPWEATGHTKAARAAHVRDMKAWVNAQLDAWLARDLVLPDDGQTKKRRAELVEWLGNYGPQIEAARQGDIAPLQEKLPMLKEFLVAPPARKRLSPAKTDHVQFALIEVQRIRQIWKQYYGRVQRDYSNPPSANEIAAARWGVTVEAMLKRAKPSGAKKPRKKLK